MEIILMLLLKLVSLGLRSTCDETLTGVTVSLLPLSLNMPLMDDIFSKRYFTDCALLL